MGYASGPFSFCSLNLPMICSYDVHARSADSVGTATGPAFTMCSQLLIRWCGGSNLLTIIAM